VPNMDMTAISEISIFLRYMAYNEDEERDEGGKWTSGGTGDKSKTPTKDLRVHATREQWSQRPNRESLGKRLGKTAQAIRERDGHKCVYCGKSEVTVPPARGVDKHQLDHLIPRLLGGKDVATNLVTACKSCNSARHTMSIDGWRAYAKEKYGIHFSSAKVWKQAAKPLPDLGQKKKGAA
jgi:5-methylcytosine-specific restriction endonuclease McrA